MCLDELWLGMLGIGIGMLGIGIGKLRFVLFLKNAENAAGPLADFAIDIPTFEEAVFFFFFL